MLYENALEIYKPAIEYAIQQIQEKYVYDADSTKEIIINLDDGYDGYEAILDGHITY